MEPWRRDFREWVVETLSLGSVTSAQAREASRFAEAVAVEMGPRERDAGLDESEMPAEHFAARRCCYLMKQANAFAAQLGVLQRTAQGEWAPTEDARVQEIAAEIAEGREYITCMAKHAGQLDPISRRALHGAVALVQTLPPGSE